ncbi:MAG: DUF3147 family protein [Trichloromonadaceae bacterium]
MGYYLLKIAVSSILIILISEIAKRSSLLGGVLASMPIVSVLALVWLYVDTKDLLKIQQLSNSIFWLVIPSLALFLLLPLLLKQGIGFWISLLLSVAGTGILYFTMIYLLKRYSLNV